MGHMMQLSPTLKHYKGKCTIKLILLYMLSSGAIKVFIKPILFFLPFLVLGLAPWSRSSWVTSRLAESHECMRAVQPELRTVLGSNPDRILGGGGRVKEERGRI